MPPTVLILAAGPGIGAQCIAKFHKVGFNVVATSRSLQDNLRASNHLELHLDLAQPESVPHIFQKLKTYFNHPRVVIYNGASRTLGKADDPLSTLSLDIIRRDTAVNIDSALIAAQQAVKGWKYEQEDVATTFIYTGNKQNVMCDPKALTFGMAKTAAAKMMWDCQAAYSQNGYRFYFTDQRNTDGSPAREAMDPEARADLYVDLAMDTKQRPWHYTFVKEQGYVDFRSVDRAWDVDV